MPPASWPRCTHCANSACSRKAARWWTGTTRCATLPACMPRLRRSSRPSTDACEARLRGPSLRRCWRHRRNVVDAMCDRPSTPALPGLCFSFLHFPPSSTARCTPPHALRVRIDRARRAALAIAAALVQPRDVAELERQPGVKESARPGWPNRHAARLRRQIFPWRCGSGARPADLAVGTGLS